MDVATPGRNASGRREARAASLPLRRAGRRSAYRAWGTERPAGRIGQTPEKAGQPTGNARPRHREAADGGACRTAADGEGYFW